VIEELSHWLLTSVPGVVILGAAGSAVLQALWVGVPALLRRWKLIEAREAETRTQLLAKAKAAPVEWLVSYCALRVARVALFTTFGVGLILAGFVVTVTPDIELHKRLAMLNLVMGFFGLGRALKDIGRLAIVREAQREKHGL